MSSRNPVIWSEGMFIRPQHFQQMERTLEHHLDLRIQTSGPYRWGIQKMIVNSSLLGIGKFGISELRAVMQDGVVIVCPEDCDAPSPLDLKATAIGQIIYLALPLSQEGARRVAYENEEGGFSRFQSVMANIHDDVTPEGTTHPIQIARPRLKLLLESEDRSPYISLPIARVSEVRSSGDVLLEGNFIPPCTDCQAVQPLVSFMNEMVGLLQHRAEALSERLGKPGQASVADISDFLMLLCVNKLDAQFRHMATLDGLHPEALHALATAAAAEISTFTSEAHRAAPLPPYDHERLDLSFRPVIFALQQALSAVLEQSAIALPIMEGKFGVRVSSISDRELLAKAKFVLAVKASVPPDHLRRTFPTQIKIGAVERIRDLITLQLPGIRLYALPVAPRQMPYHVGFAYFELDQSGEYWQDMRNAGGFAFHLSGDFPDLQMEFWAIRGR